VERIVISEFMDQEAVERLGAAFSVLYDPALVDDRGRLMDELGDAAGLIVRNRTRVDLPLLSAAPHLRIVGRLGVGLDNIDVRACAAHNVLVAPATGANTISVAEYVIAAALSLTRGAYGATQNVIAGEWPRQRLIGGELSGRVMGLVGFGAIARAVAARARALGMTIIAHDPMLSQDDPAWSDAQSLTLPELLARSDVISLHVPLTDATRRMIDGKALATVRKGAILINTARGGVVDEMALAEALKNGTLAGAALDVFEIEPLTAGSAAHFEGIEGLILTPHIAGVTEESNSRVGNVIADAVLAALGVAQ